VPEWLNPDFLDRLDFEAAEVKARRMAMFTIPSDRAADAAQAGSSRKSR